MARPPLLLRLSLFVGMITIIAAACGNATDDAAPSTTVSELAASGTRSGSDEVSDEDAALGASGTVAPAADEASSTTTTATTSTTTTSSSTTTLPPTTTTTTTTTTAPTTTTTAAPTTTTAAAGGSAAPAGAVGVIGCSNTGQAVDGYHTVSSIDALTGGELGGGSVPRWGLPSGDRYGFYWGLYDARRPAGGYSGTWVQLCLRDGEHGGVFDDAEKTWITHIIDQVHGRDPGIPVWISPINFYGGGQICTSTGVDGPAIAASAADWAAASLANVARGPDLGPLLPNHIGVRDDCHPNGAGELLMGEQLASFFD